MDTLQITFNIATGKKAEAIDDLCAAWGYNPAKDGTKAAFVQRNLANYIKDTIRSYRTGTAYGTARATTSANVDALTIS